MIVSMRKIFVAARRGDRDRLLDSLRDLGAVHVQPVDPAGAVATAETLGHIDHLGRAIQILEATEPEGSRPDLPPVEAAEEVLQIQHGAAEGRARLGELHRQIEQLEMWGDVRREQFDLLRRSGLDLRFYSASLDQVSEFRGELVQVLSELAKDRCIIAVVLREGAEVPPPPDDAIPIELPERDRPAIREEARGIDEKLKKGAERLKELANLAEEMAEAREELHAGADYTVAQRSGLSDDNLFALQGWIPADRTDTLADDLAADGLDAAHQIREPEDDEEPPTLIRYPRWVKPIKGLFDILGTTPGYREYDLSPFFMIALPVFTAMILGDAGYGLIFILFATLFYRKLVAKAGRPAIHLLLVFGFVTLGWGILTGNYFGVTPTDVMYAGGQNSLTEMRNSSGFLPAMGNLMVALGVLWRPDPETARNVIIKLSFIFGSIHLVVAHLRQALGLAPNLRFLKEVGWSAFLIGMLGVVWMLFFPDEIWMPQIVMMLLLAGGFGLVVLFSHPSRNPLKMIGLGLISNVLPVISTFSDTISYIRLMAVGLASYYIASAFNGLAWQVVQASAWLLPAGVLIVVFAHSLNIALGVIAIFAHGVRLNMLEFSSNAGVQWQGSPYAPFAKRLSPAS